MEDQDYSTGFGTLTLPLSLPLIVRHTEKIPSCFEDFNIFRTAAQMQLKFFIKNFDQYDFLLPPHKSCVIRATLQAKAFYHLSRKQLENFFTKFQYIQDDEISLKPPQQHSQQTQNHKELW